MVSIHFLSFLLVHVDFQLNAPYSEVIYIFAKNERCVEIHIIKDFYASLLIRSYLNNSNIVLLLKFSLKEVELFFQLTPLF